MIDIKKATIFFKRKWLSKECRHLCIICPYWKAWCSYEAGCPSKYERGYIDGYDDGYNEAMKRTYKTK